MLPTMKYSLCVLRKNMRKSIMTAAVGSIMRKSTHMTAAVGSIMRKSIMTAAAGSIMRRSTHTAVAVGSIKETSGTGWGMQ